MEKNIQAKKKIYHEITIAKGIGILLVVLGHAMKQTGMTDQLTAGLIQLIYSFHMPLFFVPVSYTHLTLPTIRLV